MNTKLEFSLPGRPGAPLVVTAGQLVIAGWTGRDRAAVEHHIEELRQLGVPAPSQVPLYYRVSATQLCQAPVVQVLGRHSSGEAEPVVFTVDATTYVSVGSDHTDRELESAGVAVSKQVCPKPVARDAWPLADVIAHWDRLVLRSYIREDGERRLYQEGAVAAIRPLEELMTGATRALGGTSEPLALPEGCVLFCGTLSALGGIRPSPEFELELHDPVLGRTIRHGYRTESLPVVA